MQNGSLTGSSQACPLFTVPQIWHLGFFFFSTPHFVKYMLLPFSSNTQAASFTFVLIGAGSGAGVLHFPFLSIWVEKISENNCPTFPSTSPVAPGRVEEKRRVVYFFSFKVHRAEVPFFGVNLYHVFYNITSRSIFPFLCKFA